MELSDLTKDVTLHLGSLVSLPHSPYGTDLADALGIDVFYVQAAFALVLFVALVWGLRLLVRALFLKRANATSDNVEPKSYRDTLMRPAPSPLAEAMSSVKSGFLAIGLFSLFINLLMLVSPLYMLQVYDRVLTSRSYETLFYLTVLAVGLIAFNALLELVRSRLLVRVGTRLDEKLGERVFQSLFKGKTMHVADGTLPLNDMATVRNFLGGTGPNAFFDAPWTPIFIALIFAFHPLLGVIALTGAILLFVIALISEAVTRAAFGKAAAKARDANSFAHATIRNVEVVKGMGMLPQLTSKWLSKNEESTFFQGLANDRVGLLTAVSKFLRPSLQVAMLGTGAYLVLQEATSPGVMIAASIIMGRALAPVEAAVSQWRSFVAARASYGRLKESFGEKPDRVPVTSLPVPTGHLLVQSLQLVPPGAAKPVLEDVSFEVHPGEICAVIGPSAAGKSSLARALVGIWPPSNGHIRLDGADLSQWIPEELGAHLGYLPQAVELFEGTVSDNISRFTGHNSEKIIEAATLAGAHDMILQLPEGYDTEIGPQGCVLSFGQRQRLGLARALYGDPALIVLDEPNASLDAAGERALMKSIKHLKEREKTVLIISHRSNILAAVDLVLMLNRGRVEAFDKRENILPKLVGQTKPLRAVSNEPTTTDEEDMRHANI